MEYPNLTNPVYSPSAPPEGGAMKVFSDMVHSYLNLVQQNPFPPSFLEGIMKSNGFGNEESIKQVLMYEIGYLVALAIGVVFIILMSLVGFCFACCRCCGNCGGKMYQKQTKSMDCKRRFLCLFLFVITLVILAGDICAFYSNNKINSAVNNSFKAFDDTVQNLKTYVNSVPQDVDIIINSSIIPINEANRSITEIGPILGGKIKNKIETRANMTLDMVQKMLVDLKMIATYLVSVNSTFHALQDQQNQVVQNLTDVRKRINATLDACKTCSPGPNLDQLTIDANYQAIPDFTDPLKTINDFLGSGIEGSIHMARQTINDIPQAVTNQTKDPVKNVQKQLKDIETEIEKVRQSIPILDTLKDVNSCFDSAANYSRQYEPEAMKYERYRWIVGLCLSSIILLVVVCNLFGLLFGPCGHRKKADPTERSCASNSGGDCFMAGSGFSFIFAWLLMLITALLFVVGGNVYTSFCKPWSNQQLYKFVDDNFNLSKELGVNLNNRNVSTLYSDCQKDSSLWSTLNLSSLFNLDEYLNISKYTGNVNSSLENTNISISDISFLNGDQQNQIAKVSASGLDTLNFTDITQQLTKNTTKTSLSDFASQLEALANSTSDPQKGELTAEAKTLRDIDMDITTNVKPLITNLTTTLTSLTAKTQNLSADLNATVKAVNDAQSYIETQVTGIVKNETRSYLNTILGYFNSYIEWAKKMLMTNLARCGPVASALNSAEVIVCEYVVDSLNAFWFSLGWCTIFLIPSIILSVKLAKYYRRMNTSDVYDGPNDHLEMTSTSQQYLIPRATAKA